ncbi:hypothetical protein J4Q44_G00383410 [Coregonus suidteri]|uniref:Transmembrane protein 168 n=1 Tax=Coregonus suidteri TaxID=861788 RepID=A0AAN8KF38_9TELE
MFCLIILAVVWSPETKQVFKQTRWLNSLFHLDLILMLPKFKCPSPLQNLHKLATPLSLRSHVTPGAGGGVRGLDLRPGVEVDMWSSVRCLGYLSSFNLMVAVCLGLILYYYFSMESASLSLSTLWFGFLLGLLCFLNNPSLEENVKEQATNYLLLASVILRTVWALTDRIMGCVHYKPTLLSSEELLELLGFGIASTTMLMHKSIALIALVVALGALIVGLRVKSLIALPNLACFALVTSLLFSSRPWG